jgi:hypothetical protein
VIEHLPKLLHASVRWALRQTWELDKMEKAERLLRSPPAGWSKKRLAPPSAFSKGSMRR